MGFIVRLNVEKNKDGASIELYAFASRLAVLGFVFLFILIYPMTFLISLAMNMKDLSLKSFILGLLLSALFIGFFIWMAFGTKVVLKRDDSKKQIWIQRYFFIKLKPEIINLSEKPYLETNLYRVFIKTKNKKEEIFPLKSNGFFGLDRWLMSDKDIKTISDTLGIPIKRQP